MKSCWLPSLDRDGSAADLTIVCFPPSGAGASFYRPWANVSPPGVRVAPMQLPAREERLSEPHPRSLSTLALSCARVIGEVVRGEFALLGHSMGGALAAETAYAIRGLDGPRPTGLLVSACDPPRPEAGTPRHPSDEELVDTLRSLGGTPEGVLASRTYLAMLLPVLRDDMEMCESFTLPQRDPLSCPIVSAGGMDDVAVPPDSMSGWSFHTTGSFVQRLFPGGHFYFNEHPQLLKGLQELLRDVR